MTAGVNLSGNQRAFDVTERQAGNNWARAVRAIPRTRQRTRGLIAGRVDEFWPLTCYFYLYPMWWVLGLSKVILFLLIVPMVVQMSHRRDLRAPHGFGIYLLFLAWVALGVFLLWVRPGGTDPKFGLSPLIGFGFRALWYAAITVACLYVLNADRSRLPAIRVIRMLGYLFIVTVAGGLLSVAAPQLDFPSVLELFLPQRLTSQEFMNALFHPRIALQSEFLGFTQARVTAPYAYPNTWGNAFGLLIPFFVVAWLGPSAGWRRFLGAAILLASVVPVVYSLNRGLWLGLGISALWIVLRRAAALDLKPLVIAATAGVLGLILLVITPLGGLIQLRIDTPHSDDRRQDIAAEVVRATWETSPVLGFGSTRQKTGNYTSLTGSGAADCRHCAVPALGTQGYVWGLVFLTGFVGAALMASFLLWQFVLNARRDTTVGLVTSTVLVSAMFYFLVYDSLDVPMLVLMMAIGLSSREHTLIRTADLRGAW